MLGGVGHGGNPGWQELLNVVYPIDRPLEPPMRPGPEIGILQRGKTPALGQVSQTAGISSCSVARPPGRQAVTYARRRKLQVAPEVGGIIETAGAPDTGKAVGVAIVYHRGLQRC